MLVLSRRLGEVMMIGDDIKITILNITTSNQVRIGIEAPRHISVHREEVYRRIQDAFKQDTSEKEKAVG